MITQQRSRPYSIRNRKIVVTILTSRAPIGIQLVYKKEVTPHKYIMLLMQTRSPKNKTYCTGLFTPNVPSEYL